MAEGMTAPLYTTEILRLAASLHEPHPLEREDGRPGCRGRRCGKQGSDCERRHDRAGARPDTIAMGHRSSWRDKPRPLYGAG